MKPSECHGHGTLVSWLGTVVLWMLFIDEGAGVWLAPDRTHCHLTGMTNTFCPLQPRLAPRGSRLPLRSHNITSLMQERSFTSWTVSQETCFSL